MKTYYATDENHEIGLIFQVPVNTKLAWKIHIWPVVEAEFEEKGYFGLVTVTELEE